MLIETHRDDKYETRTFAIYGPSTGGETGALSETVL